jgi:hypothetical protein
MMTCSDCRTNLDDVAVGTPCPNCGSLPRDVKVSPPTVAAIGHILPPTISTEDEDESASHVVAGQAVDLTVSMSVDAFLAQPVVREVVVQTHDITLRILPPDGDSTGWTLQAWDGDDLISQAPADSFDDAYLAIGDEIKDAVTGDD